MLRRAQEATNWQHCAWRQRIKVDVMNWKKPIDEKTGFDIAEEFSRFDQRNKIYCRSEWDEEIKSNNATAFFSDQYMPNARARKADGFGKKDYNRDFRKWYNRVWRRLEGTWLRTAMLQVDVFFYKRTRQSSARWWGGT